MDDHSLSAQSYFNDLAIEDQTALLTKLFNSDDLSNDRIAAAVMSRVLDLPACL